MKLRDNIPLFTAALAAAGLESAFLAACWNISEVEPVSRTFLLEGQVFIAGACALVYGASRVVLQPLQAIADGIARYAQGDFAHRIPVSRVGELDLLVRQLNGMAARLAELDALKSGFVANVSHELRSPLAAMEQYLDILLASADIAGKNRENLARVQANLARLRGMVGNLLDISKIEAGTLDVKNELYDLAETVQDVCALLAPKIAAKGLALETKLPSPAPLRGDADKIRQILTNLVDNAAKYNHDGGRVTVSASLDGAALTLSVSDNGPGIAAEDLGKLFERFRRLPGAQASGAGLGLSISRGLARAMGGDLTAESRLGAGSTFTCTVPIRGGS